MFELRLLRMSRRFASTPDESPLRTCLAILYEKTATTVLHLFAVIVIWDKIKRSKAKKNSSAGTKNACRPYQQTGNACPQQVPRLLSGGLLSFCSRILLPPSPDVARSHVEVQVCETQLWLRLLLPGNVYLEFHLQILLPGSPASPMLPTSPFHRFGRKLGPSRRQPWSQTNC